ncbi:MAG: M81 family metallopeptidase [Bryobacteraceae bacterium]|nr:M81 family metallopeptidase [Bryobacteraceae bacterium]
MPRILVCECKQEVSSFNPVLAHYGDFLVDRGDDILAYHRDVRSEMGGALRVFGEHPHLEIVPGYSARGITSSGTLADADFRRLADEFLSAVRAAGPLDGIYYALHGALASETEFDPEGYFLAETRKIVGERIPIVVSLDLHGILTDQILQHADAVAVYLTYPHVDFYETGERAAHLLVRLLNGEIRPVTARVPIPALVRGYELITETGRFGHVVRRAAAVGISGGMFIGNPFTDVPELCSNAFVVTDGDAALAEREGVSLAREFWEMREHLQQPLTPLRESVHLAASLSGRVVLVDAADATSSGASGDSNAILQALLETGCQRTSLIPVVDQPAVDTALRAGVGAEVTVPVGGTLDPRFTPVRVTGRVVSLSDGHIVSESHGEAWYAGPTAVLQCGPMTLVLTSRAISLYDRSLFLANGLHPADFAMTVVKSPHCQPRFFADGAELLINVDAPGSTSANLRSLGHRRCARPMFPLDAEVPFEPKARIFRRERS